MCLCRVDSAVMCLYCHCTAAQSVDVLPGVLPDVPQAYIQEVERPDLEGGALDAVCEKLQQLVGSLPIPLPVIKQVWCVVCGGVLMCDMIT